LPASSKKEKNFKMKPSAFLMPYTPRFLRMATAKSAENTSPQSAESTTNPLANTGILSSSADIIALQNKAVLVRSGKKKHPFQLNSDLGKINWALHQAGKVVTKEIEANSTNTTLVSALEQLISQLTEAVFKAETQATLANKTVREGLLQKINTLQKELKPLPSQLSPSLFQVEAQLRLLKTKLHSFNPDNATGVALLTEVQSLSAKRRQKATSISPRQYGSKFNKKSNQ
jgi:DNA repair ATPase RecN